MGFRAALRATRNPGHDKGVISYSPDVLVRCDAVPSMESIDIREAYVLSATVKVNFWANRAQYEHARENAERQILMFVYEDLVYDITAIQAMIYAGDSPAAQVALANMHHKLLEVA